MMGDVFGRAQGRRPLPTGYRLLATILKGSGDEPDFSGRAGQDGVLDSFTWTKGIASQTDEEGASDPIRVDYEGNVRARIRIAQIGDAELPASAMIEYRDDEAGPWEVFGEGFTAEIDDGVYESALAIPPHAHEIRLTHQPQQGGDSSVLSAVLVRGPPTISEIFERLVLMLFTDNLLRSMVEINLLPLIAFSIIFAALLTTMGSAADTIRQFVVSVNSALMNFIMLLMKIAPLGIFCLVASRFAKAQLDGQFMQLISVQFKYMSTVLVGLGIHAFATLPLILWVFTRRNPYRFLGQMSQAVLTAFSTASSTATLPVTMECAEANANVSKRSTEFVLPLGATINMDGTALYEAAGAIFIAQALGLELTMFQQLTIAVTATLAAIGAAGIPEAGLVTMLIVLNAVGLPIEAIGLIIPVDWLLDRFRTAVNAFGDSVGAAIVDGSFESSNAEGALEPAPVQSESSA